MIIKSSKDLLPILDAVQKINEDFPEYDERRDMATFNLEVVTNMTAVLVKAFGTVLWSSENDERPIIEQSFGQDYQDLETYLRYRIIDISERALKIGRKLA